MRGTGLPRELRRKKRGDKSGKGREHRNKVIRTWSLTVCGSAVIFLGLMIFFWVIPQMQSDESAIEEVSAKPGKLVRVASKFPSPSEEAAIALVREALSIREPERVGDFFRLGAALPEEVVSFLTKMESVDGVIENCRWLSSMDANGLSIDGVFVSFKSEEKPLPRLALLTPDEAGKWKVDFEAFARTVKPSWKEILEKGADLAQVRIYATKDSYYNGVFRDDKQWVCHRISSPDTEEILLAYCRVGSRQAAAMSWMYSKGEALSRAILEVRHVEGAESRQFEIMKVVAEDWVLGDVAFEAGFNDFK